jgi:hypothetical protein
LPAIGGSVLRIPFLSLDLIIHASTELGIQEFYYLLKA